MSESPKLTARQQQILTLIERAIATSGALTRSEERRVGKECRL